jgi:hypothetical protein
MFVRHVGGDSVRDAARISDLLDHSIEWLGVSGDEDDARTRLCKGVTESASEAAATAGDENCLVSKIHR